MAVAISQLAERARFELAVLLRGHQFSRLTHSTALPPLHVINQRRGGDSNPRYANKDVQQVSNLPLSATQPPLHILK